LLLSKSPTLRFIFQQLKQYKKEIALGVLLLIITNILGITIPIKIKDIIDQLVSGELRIDYQSLREPLLFILMLAISMALVRISSRVCIFGIGRKVESEQKQAFYQHLLSLDYLYFNTQRIGDLISRATSDIQAIRQMMGFGLLNVVNIVWVYAFTLPVMISLNPSLTCLLLLGYAPVLFAVYRLSFRLKHLQQRSQEKLGDLSSFIEEDINGIQIIKAYSQEKREIQRFKQINSDYVTISTELAKARVLIWPVLGITRAISFFLLIVYVALGWLTPGATAAFLLYMERLVFPTAIMGWLITIFQRGSVSVGRLEEVYSQNSCINDSCDQELLVKEGEIEFRNLSFAYQVGQHDVLRNLSFVAPGGKFVGVVGMIASGKSTLCLNLMRVVDTPADSVFIDGQDITGCSLQSLRREVSFLPQESFLFNATVLENITLFGGGDIDSQKTIDICKLCQIHDEIVNLKDGYQTVVGEKGVSLSGGQAQRIALARSLMLSPQILILDDALASIDNETALQILKAIRDKFHNLTLILLTHRISSLKEADEILLLHQGQCIDHGSHQQLLDNNAIYQKLWKGGEQLTLK